MNIKLVDEIYYKLLDFNDLFYSLILNNKDRGVVLYNDMRYKAIVYSSFPHNKTVFHLEDVFKDEVNYIEIPYNEINELKNIITIVMEHFDGYSGLDGIKNEKSIRFTDKMSNSEMEEYMNYIRSYK